MSDSETSNGEDSVLVTAKIKKAVLNGNEGYVCDMPLPFVKGEPANYTEMTPDELRKFIDFAYKSVFKKLLPQSSNTKQKVPSWWPASVSFDKHLKVVLPNEKISTQLNQRRELMGLLEAFYEGFGMKILLEVAQALADPNIEGVRLVRRPGDDPWDVTTSSNKLVMALDPMSRLYDLNSRERAKIKTKEVENHVPTDAKVTRQNKKRLGSVDTRRSGPPKRKLFEEDDEDFKIQVEEVFKCQYCNSEHRLIEFRDDHENECIKGPRGAVTQDGFMMALGMQNKSIIHTEPTASTSGCDSKPKDPIPPTLKQTKRPLRKLPQRNKVLALAKNCSIPLTSERGQRLVKELGASVKPIYPPPYEKACELKSSYASRTRNVNFPTVTKKIIEKHGEHPHIYSYGRRQRAQRNQELIIGLNSRAWKLLNQCKKARLVIEKIKPVMETVKVDPSAQLPYVHRKLGGTKTPHVKLIDISTIPNKYILKYWNKGGLQSSK